MNASTSDISFIHHSKKKFHGLSPGANYTDRETATLFTAAAAANSDMFQHNPAMITLHLLPQPMHGH
jgi:hypothetical protein